MQQIGPKISGEYIIRSFSRLKRNHMFFLRVWKRRPKIPAFFLNAATTDRYKEIESVATVLLPQVRHLLLSRYDGGNGDQRGRAEGRAGEDGLARTHARAAEAALLTQ